jgi:hypothetical protein
VEQITRREASAPDQTETESSMMFVAAKPATATARMSFALIADRRLGGQLEKRCAS